ncbi:hypothetical protein ACFRAR_21820 [Kitasatospora sp. NPDC056651]|uniref:hypothetical protein n=1 Tax=Kitasatospora sp. NPDC056651 TaxID=3345892 RepID=UPI00367B7616
MFRDLMVTVLGDEGTHCDDCSVISCDLPTVRCGELTCPLTSVIQDRRDVDTLPLLRRELQNALRQVELAEGRARARSQPRTASEADFLEKELRGALDEVRRLKAALPPA